MPAAVQPADSGSRRCMYNAQGGLSCAAGPTPAQVQERRWRSMGTAGLAPQCGRGHGHGQAQAQAQAQARGDRHGEGGWRRGGPAPVIEGFADVPRKADAAGGAFTSSCRACTLVNDASLKCTCDRETTLDLDSRVGVRDGKLVAPGAGYTKACSRCSLTGAILACAECKNGATGAGGSSSIDLGALVHSDNGELK